MPRSTEILSLVFWGITLVAALSLAPEPRAADGGSSALPRREDVSYHMPGASVISDGLLSWTAKYDNDSAFAGLDSVTPSLWVLGPVYGGVTWFWKENGLPGDTFFAGFSSNLDTVVYDPPMRWLPLDPVATSDWETTANSSKGETWTFRFHYDGIDTLLAGRLISPEEFVCWRILLEQEGPPTAGPDRNESSIDGMGIPRETQFGAKAFSDTLYYEVDVLPRRRIRYATQFSQQEFIYESHTTRETPVPTLGTGVGGFKAGFRQK